MVIFLKELIKMEIDKHIKWDKIWKEEICLQASIDCLNENDETEIEIINIIQQFISDKNVTLNFDECFLNSESQYEGTILTFFFSETGGQNESDMQGWSRDYIFIVNEGFLIIDAVYTQG